MPSWSSGNSKRRKNQWFLEPLAAYQQVIEVMETTSKQSMDVSHSQYNAPYFSVFPQVKHFTHSTAFTSGKDPWSQ
jgi:hypothetical protein